MKDSSSSSSSLTKKQKRNRTAEEEAERKELKRRKRQKKEEESNSNNKKKRKRKRKKSKKDKKSKRETKQIVFQDDDEPDKEEDTPTPPAQIETKGLGAKPSRIVASSTIEFYEDTLKAKLLRETKKEKKAKKKQNQKRTEGEEEQETKPKYELVKQQQKQFNSTLLLFYQYIEPVWEESTYQFMLSTLDKIGKALKLTGRMRVAREGVNCTLTGAHEDIIEYTKQLRQLRPKEFSKTEFKLTTELPKAQTFPNLKVIPVVELVHYGLEGPKAPPIAKFSGTHLEPQDYHKKLGESNTVVIDVRNHYEANIGRFVPPKHGEGVKQGEEPPKWLDPKMRKSTEFPVWMDKPEVKEEMKGKQVLMYCTGTCIYAVLYALASIKSINSHRCSHSDRRHSL